ncbi:MAG: hypothetical protein ACD_79C01014G0008 [uncultured bacterium]|nr:MAG: hypothetical protein ACD_79C01014G0008 [uncultured bacterium]
MSAKVKIACIQMSYKKNYEKTIKVTENLFVQACKKNAKIICFQELFHSDYFCQSIDEVNFSKAVSIPGELTQMFCALAKKFQVVVILPVFERRLEGLYSNSAAVINHEGKILDVYRKIHIPDDPCFYEKYYFSEGESGYKVFDTKYGKIAVLICWDQWFPEAARIVSLMGAQAIFYPTAIGIIKGEEKSSKKFCDAWKTIQRASAIANGVYVAAVNRTGEEGNLKFWGNSFICDPFGEVVTEGKSNKDEILYADLDYDAIAKTRHMWPFLRDRRVDTYKDIISKALARKN